MKSLTCSILAAFSLLTSCSSDSNPAPNAGTAPAGNTPASAPAAGGTPATSPAAAHVPSAIVPADLDMDAAIKVLMAQPEHADESITVQHILIAFQGVPRVTGVTRSKDEAHALASKVYAEAIAGGDYDALVKQHTNDSAPGIYPLTKSRRNTMVKGFGDVGFRLKVGEIGVAPWDTSASPFGWHIIKRVK